MQDIAKLASCRVIGNDNHLWFGVEAANGRDKLPLKSGGIQ